MCELIVKTTKLNKCYSNTSEKVIALENIDLNIFKGDMVSLIGPSGSGKSTLLNVLGCMDSFEEGSYFLGGLDVTNTTADEQALIRLNKIGFVFQSFQLINTISILENVGLSLMYAGIHPDERKERAKNALSLVGLHQIEDRMPKQLSGGQQQRVAIARAIVKNPLILLADEPTGNLDSKTRDDIFDIFENLNEMGVTIIMATHDRELCDRAGVQISLKDGRKVNQNAMA
ncbi:ABC transporter ATP-binding protein [Alteromonas sp. BMJM2]|uniref:ABC transporter ATP-binding protein n=1 Tax=Alteromonas sp. BMJM2 TaxID=2954241 RepID=UPI0022B4F77B|nr:ABC transporter ATP-binding protein [Alteromonas sp. BMJM2]